MTDATPDVSPEAVDAFIARWQKVGGTERASAKSIERMSWPKEMPEQVNALADALVAARNPLSLDEITERFSGKGQWKKRLPHILQTLVAVVRA